MPLTTPNLRRNRQQVSPAPYIFFHRASGYRWEEGTDPILLNCRSINEEAVQHLLSSLSINVSQPDALLAWLEINDASYITSLHVHLDAYYKAPSATRWSRLFEKLGREATNLQHLSVYWDHEGYIHRGLGMDISFVQALVQLKVAKTISIRGFYAQRWPEYIEEKMGLKPFDDENIPGTAWSRMLKSYQKGTEGIRP
jgi:hypothetical protein